MTNKLLPAEIIFHRLGGVESSLEDILPRVTRSFIWGITDEDPGTLQEYIDEN